ncbi:MAG: hypothetical protein KDJ16_00945 [Hyphomicrobiales bacterium]|nr:hypothetical protein [Hyphomicrobiales bacterium]
MRSMYGILVAALCLAVCGAAAAEPARAKHGRTRPAAAAGEDAAGKQRQTCPRANYPGDPVCAWDDDGRNLPTPSASAVRREIPDDVVISDKMSVGGADPVAMAKPPVQSSNPYPVRKKEPVGGGAAVNYRF